MECVVAVVVVVVFVPGVVADVLGGTCCGVGAGVVAFGLRVCGAFSAGIERVRGVLLGSEPESVAVVVTVVATLAVVVVVVVGIFGGLEGVVVGETVSAVVVGFQVVLLQGVGPV